jgi:hypothetical protein
VVLLGVSPNHVIYEIILQNHQGSRFLYHKDAKHCELGD